jgi:hypothetical protein
MPHRALASIATNDCVYEIEIEIMICGEMISPPWSIPASGLWKTEKADY